MQRAFLKKSSQYKILKNYEKIKSDEIVIRFREKIAVQRFFNDAMKGQQTRAAILNIAKEVLPSYCRTSKDINRPIPSEQDTIDQLCVKIHSGELLLVKKSEVIKRSVDPIGVFNWEKFFSDPRVPDNFLNLDDEVQSAMIRAWKEENDPLTITEIFKPTNFERSRSSRGTIGIGISTTAGTGKAISGTYLVVFDDHGNVGYLMSGGGGGMGGSSVSGTFLIQVTNAKDIYELKGLSTQTGGSLGEGLSVGLEYIAGNGYQGVNFSFGLGQGLTVGELHSIAEYASVKGAKVDEIVAYVKNIKLQN